LLRVKEMAATGSRQWGMSREQLSHASLSELFSVGLMKP